VTRLLLISGSARRGSANAAVLATAAELTAAQTETYEALTALPIFTPDDDEEGEPVPAPVAALRAAIARADAILICTPEYAGALPAGLKNLLEWTVGDGGTYGKPVAWINASGAAAPTGGADAHDSLRKVLTYTGADIVAAACARIPVSRAQVGPAGTITDAGVREQIGAAAAALLAAA
jgi:chromate reductase